MEDNAEPLLFLKDSVQNTVNDVTVLTSLPGRIGYDSNANSAYRSRFEDYSARFMRVQPHYYRV